MSERLPIPDWSRPNELWRVVPETAVHWVSVDALRCDYGHRRGCNERAIVGIERYGQITLALCEPHLRDGGMWIENGVVVSWCLVPDSSSRLGRRALTAESLGSSPKSGAIR